MKGNAVKLVLGEGNKLSSLSYVSERTVVQVAIHNAVHGSKWVRHSRLGLDSRYRGGGNA
jgi:hypothetical protein